MKRSVWQSKVTKKTTLGTKPKSLPGGISANIRQLHKSIPRRIKRYWPQSRRLRSYKNLPRLEIYSNPQELDFYLAETRSGLTTSEKKAARLFKPNSLVLDIGCAAGREALGLARLGHQVLGIDGNKAILPLAKRLADTQGLNIQYRAGIFPAIQFPPKSFDVVLLTGIAIAHTPNRINRIQTLREAARIVRSDGLVVVEMRDRDATPYERSLHAEYAKELAELRRTDPTAEFGDSLSGRSSKRVKAKTGTLRYHFHNKAESLAELAAAGLTVYKQIPRIRMVDNDPLKQTVYVQYVCKPRNATK